MQSETFTLDDIFDLEVFKMLKLNEFVFTKYQYSVLEVNQTSYENCVEADFITNITRGGRDVFQLNNSRPYYFISGYGQCWGGVKLAINVEDIPPPQPSPPKSAATSVESQVSTLLMMFLIWAFIPHLS
uniref:Phytocyanin domain-containing protein n=1 Tax=Kalanchoe fedtschenkoi TaxID=63787 RepID=A0A7N0VMI3_KALFE